MAKKRRLLWQLYPSYLLIIIISLVVVSWYSFRAVKRFYLDQTAIDLEVRARLFENQILGHLDPLNEGVIDSLCEKSGKRASTRITVITASGKVIGDSEEDPARMDNHPGRRLYSSFSRLILLAPR